ncbi:MAG: sigma-70 family RNA polymerase sigma factor [Verrucomicrobiales bacterium]|nr:sigma-70 family RNA polymerase sigma factor [Verrucomicrobiales bacterium]
MNEVILKNLATFVAFTRKRVGDPHLAEDLVQESLVKALGARGRPVDGEDTLAWFYRVLRRTIIDLYRRRAARSRALERYQQELSESPSPSDTRVLCACLKRLLPAVPETYRELVERIDLQGEDPSMVAQVLGLTRNNLTVRLHRARRHLRVALSKNCRACSKHGCLDCTCGNAGEGSHGRGDDSERGQFSQLIMEEGASRLGGSARKRDAYAKAVTDRVRGSDLSPDEPGRPARADFP